MAFTTVPSGTSWDCSIGDLKFLFAIGDEFPMRRETADFRRQRIDTQASVGEQSLDSGYWLRSQSSWHYGAGLTSAEPLEVNSEEAAFRFKESGGIDPWTPGQLSLLHSASSLYSVEGDQLLIGVTGADFQGVLHVATYTPEPVGDVGTTVETSFVSFIDSNGVVTPISWGGFGVLTSIASDGVNWYAANENGIYSGALPYGSGSKIWDTGDSTVVRWVKSRLMATVGPAVYELTGTGPTLPTALDPGTARPAGWQWTDMAEGPTSIYLSGYSGDVSTIERIGVSASSTTVSLDAPITVAEMPRGETVLSLYSYVGSYLIVGTSKGVRVASINADGSLTLGPLILDFAPVDDAVAIGNFVYVTARAQGNAGDRVRRAGLYRINLGQNINNNALDFAYAADLTAPSGVAGDAVQVTTAFGRLYFAVNDAGVFRQDDSYVTDGWLESGRIRMGTLEAKSWRALRVIMDETSSGSVTGWASPDGTLSPSNWTEVVTGSPSAADVTGSMAGVSASPVTNMYVALELSGDGSTNPVMTGYQLRAIPAPQRTYLLQVPLMLFDFNTDRTGVRVGYPGFAWEALTKLQDLEESAAVVTWSDYTTGETATAYVEKVSFSRVAPPTSRTSGAGGVAQVLLRLV